MRTIMFNDRYGLTEAVLQGRKTQTRRNSCRYKVGEVVAIAQNYKDVQNESAELNDILLDANGKPEKEFIAGWSNKMFIKPAYMPHHIRITSMRQERLQDISDGDCMREGIYFYQHGNTQTSAVDGYYYSRSKQPYSTPRAAYSMLIDKVSGKGTWASNPMVWVYDFELLD